MLWRLSFQKALIVCVAVAVMGLPTTLCAASQSVDVDLGLSDFRQGRFAEALEDWRQAEVAGDPRGALFEGVLYDSGIGVTQDYQQAMSLYRQAAEEGSAPGAFNVGVLYDAGLGVPIDLAQAASWYERAADAGFGRAEYNLAMLYESGSGVTHSLARALELYKRAAAHGITAAVGHLRARGQAASNVVLRPKDTAMDDFQKAQRVLMSRGPGDAAEAAALFRRAAEQHNALAEYDLGYCYEHGIGVAREPSQAYAWYRRAADDAADNVIRSIAQVGASNLEGQTRQAQLPQPPRIRVP